MSKAHRALLVSPGSPLPSDGFGGGWTKSQILKIMRDSRNGSYATMGGCLWVVARCAIIGHLGSRVGPGGSVWALGASQGAGPAIVVAQAVARASAAPLIYTYAYVVDDEDAKGEFYNWFGDCKRLLGPWRVLLAFATAASFAYGLLAPFEAQRVLAVTAVGTLVAGQYGQSVLGGVMGDFLGATICMLELAIYLALAADWQPEDLMNLTRLVVVVSLPQIYGWWTRREAPPAQDC